jgi:hypothetical protein
MFQSALMGMTLLASIKTRKTLRVHEGLTGSFAYQEQMCALENLRIWQDPETHGVVAMLHFTPQFKDGYLAFYCTCHMFFSPLSWRAFFSFLVLSSFLRCRTL